MELFDFVRIARTAVSTTRRVVTASIVGIGNVGDDASAERVDNCEIAQPLGLFAVPVLTTQTEGVVVRLADRPFILCVLDKGRTAQACEAGGTKLYGVGADNAAAVIYVRATGAIEVTSKTNTNIILTADGTGVVRFQDGSQAFVRGGDYSTALTTFLNVDNTTLAGLSTVMVAVGTFATAVGAALPPVAGAAAVLNTAIGVFTGLVTARINAGTAYGNSSSTWLSTRVFGQ